MWDRGSLSLCGESVKFLGKTGVQILLHCERKKWYGMAEAGNLKTTRGEGLWRGADASHTRRRRANPFYC
jgi:hypothetical protein